MKTILGLTAAMILVILGGVLFVYGHYVLGIGCLIAVMFFQTEEEAA